MLSSLIGKVLSKLMGFMLVLYYDPEQQALVSDTFTKMQDAISLDLEMGGEY